MFLIIRKKVCYHGRLSSIPVLLILLTLPCAVFAQTLVNPYEGIDWESINQYRANLHTHSTESDGALPPETVIDEYSNRNYDILSLTDHRTVTYPWQNWGRDPVALGMLDISGCEYSNHNHLNGFFIEYTTNPHSEVEALEEIAAQGGIAHLNHPGDYWSPDSAGNVPDAVIQKYVAWFSQFSPDVLMGMEVVNKTHLHPSDEDLWDALLEVMMPERPIWGFSNDDMHTLAIGPVRLIEVSWETFLADSLDAATIRNAMLNGIFYFSTCGTRIDPYTWDVNQVPKITDIVHDEIAGTLTISAVSGGAPLPESEYKWISMGEVVQVGRVLDYKNTDGVGNYVRAQLEGTGGTTFTNPFGLIRDDGRLVVYISPADAIYSGAKWKIEGTSTWYQHADDVHLAPGAYTLVFGRVDSYQTPDPITVTVTANKTTLVTSAQGAAYVYDPEMAMPATGAISLAILMLALLTVGTVIALRVNPAGCKQE